MHERAKSIDCSGAEKPETEPSLVTELQKGIFES